MQVTRLEPVGKGKCRVYLNDEPAFLLYRKEVSACDLEEGKELEEKQSRKIYEEILLKRAKLRCLHLLEAMDRTEQQLYQKLRQGEYPEEVIRAAVEYVKGYHYVDDLRYAQNYIEVKKDSRSRRQLCSELAGKGVPEELIRQALEEAPPADELQQIRKWAEKKRFSTAEAGPDETRKFFQFLIRKGFSFSDIKKALT